MSSAITTRFHGPSPSRPARVTARCGSLQVTLPWDYELGEDNNHQAAALEMARRMKGTAGRWIAGQLPNSDRVWVHDGSQQSYLGESFYVQPDVADAEDEAPTEKD